MYSARLLCTVTAVRRKLVISEAPCPPRKEMMFPDQWQINAAVRALREQRRPLPTSEQAFKEASEVRLTGRSQKGDTEAL
jgi:hypothetical protein